MHPTADEILDQWTARRALWLAASPAFVDENARVCEAAVERATAAHAGMLADFALSVRLGAGARTVARAAAVHPHTPPSALGVLARVAEETDDWYLRGDLATNPSCPPEVLEHLASVDHEGIHMALLQNPSTPAAAHSALAKSGAKMRSLVARGAHTPIVVLTELARDTSAAVRAAVAAHPHVPAEVLERLAADTEIPVRTAVGLHPRAPRERIAQLEEQVRIAKDEATAQGTLVAMSQSEDAYVRHAVAWNPSALSAVLEKLAKEKGARWGLASNPRTSPALLDRWAKDKNAELRQCVVVNPSTSRETLVGLSRDRDSWVARAAKRRLET